MFICTDRWINNEQYLSDEKIKLYLEKKGINCPDGNYRAAFYKTKLWPKDHVIRVKFFGGKEWQQVWVKKVILEQFSPYCKQRFDFVSNNKQADIRITFDPNGGAWSNLGNDAMLIPSSEPTMNLGWLDPPGTRTQSGTFIWNGKTYTVPAGEPRNSGFTNGSTVMHEFGHVMGMIHEHQNPKDNKIQWNETAVYNYFGGPPNNWSKQIIYNNILQKYSESQVNGSMYDKSSIMLYFFPSTLTLNGIGTSANRDLSKQDKEWITNAFMDNSYIPVVESFNGGTNRTTLKPIINRFFCTDRYINNEGYIGDEQIRRFYKLSGIDDVNPDYVRAAFYKTKLWPKDQIIRVKFLDGEPWRKAWVEKVITEKFAPYIPQTIVFNSEPAQIRIKFDSTLGSWSYVGTDAMNANYGDQTLNLGWVDPPGTYSAGGTFTWNNIIYTVPPGQSRNGGFTTGATVVHEFGHALGMIHEHQNPRNNPIQWNESTIYASLSGPPNNWDDSTIYNNVLMKYSTSLLNGSLFDPLSIMQYFYPSSWTLDGRSQSIISEMSKMDKDWLSLAYINSPSSLPPPTTSSTATSSTATSTTPPPTTSTTPPPTTSTTPPPTTSTTPPPTTSTTPPPTTSTTPPPTTSTTPPPSTSTTPPPSTSTTPPPSTSTTPPPSTSTTPPPSTPPNSTSTATSSSTSTATTSIEKKPSLFNQLFGNLSNTFILIILLILVFYIILIFYHFINK